jgi:GntR family transcriptional regulator
MPDPTPRKITTRTRKTSAPPAGVDAPPDRTTRTLLKQLPRYQQIAMDLRERIDSGELAPGDPIPSETEMIATYGVSRITVRHAIAALRASGLVITEHGRPSRVRATQAATSDDPSGSVLVFDPSVVRHSDGAFRTWDDEGWADVEAPSRYRTTAGRHAAALQLAPDEPVFVLERQLLHTTGVQVMHRVYVPFVTASSVPALQDDPFLTPAALYQALVSAVQALDWEDSVTAAMPAPDDATTLDIPEGVPLLLHTRVITGRDGGSGESSRLAAEETRLPAHRATVVTKPGR